MSHIATEPFLLSIFITMSDDKTKSQQRIWDCNKFHFLPNLSVSNSCWLTMLVGILCDVSPICQSLRSAHSRDSTGNGCSRSKVLRNLHIVRHQVPHLSKKVYDCIATSPTVLAKFPHFPISFNGEHLKNVTIPSHHLPHLAQMPHRPHTSIASAHSLLHCGMDGWMDGWIYLTIDCS